MKDILVAAVGCYSAGDDAIGLHLAKDLAALNPDVELRLWEDADSLTVAQELLETKSDILLLDCADMGLPAGSTRIFRRESIRFRTSSVSTHGFGLAEAVDLACTLGFSSDIRIFGIQPFDCSPGKSLSEAMWECYPAILRELQHAYDDIKGEVSSYVSCSTHENSQY
jgi:hydrogenase maturation protease